MAGKILVGIETRDKKDKDTGKVIGKHTILHLLEDAGQGPMELIGQRVFKENLWNIADVKKELKVVGDFKIGCHIEVYYQGEGDFKQPAMIVCEK